MEGLWGSIHSLEPEVVFLLDDGIYILHQTYSLQSSCKIGIQAGQVSQEIHSPSAMRNTLQGQNQSGMKMPQKTPKLLVHSGVNCHKFDCFPLFVVGSQKKKLTPADH